MSLELTSYDGNVHVKLFDNRESPYPTLIMKFSDGISLIYSLHSDTIEIKRKEALLETITVDTCNDDVLLDSKSVEPDHKGTVKKLRKYRTHINTLMEATLYCLKMDHLNQTSSQPITQEQFRMYGLNRTNGAKFFIPKIE